MVMVKTTEKNKPNILIVDDVPGNIDVLRGILSPSYKVSAARSAKRALEIINTKSKPDLILLDIVMPEMDGYELCKILKSHKRTKSIPIIFVSGQSAPKDESYGLELGAADYITKPINPMVVKRRIKTHLELSQYQRRLQAELQSTISACINTYGEILARSRPEAFSRSQRLKRTVKHLAEKLELKQKWKCEVAANLSQIGCIYLPQYLVRKAASGDELSAQELEQYKGYPELSYQLLRKIPYLKESAEIIRSLKEFELQAPTADTDEDFSKYILALSAKIDDLEIKGLTRQQALDEIHAAFPQLLNDKIKDALIESNDDSLVVDIKMVEPGMVLAKDILSIDGGKLLPMGSELNEITINQLFDRWSSKLPATVSIYK